MADGVIESYVRRLLRWSGEAAHALALARAAARDASQREVAGAVLATVAGEAEELREMWLPEWPDDNGSELAGCLGRCSHTVFVYLGHFVAFQSAFERSAASSVPRVEVQDWLRLYQFAAVVGAIAAGDAATAWQITD